MKVSCVPFAALDDRFDTQSTLAELPEPLRRGLQGSLYIHLIGGHRVCSFSIIAPATLLTNAIATPVLCL